MQGYVQQKGIFQLRGMFHRMELIKHFVSTNYLHLHACWMQVDFIPAGKVGQSTQQVPDQAPAVDTHNGTDISDDSPHSDRKRKRGEADRRRDRRSHRGEEEDSRRNRRRHREETGRKQRKRRHESRDGSSSDSQDEEGIGRRQRRSSSHDRKGKEEDEEAEDAAAPDRCEFHERICILSSMWGQIPSLKPVNKPLAQQMFPRSVCSERRVDG